MKLTIKEVKDIYKNKYIDIEVYNPCDIGKYYPDHFHTDNCNLIDASEYDDNTEVGLWELMDEEDYQHSILANSCEVADFAQWYDDKNAKALIMMLAEDEVVRREKIKHGIDDKK